MSINRKKKSAKELRRRRRNRNIILAACTALVVSGTFLGLSMPAATATPELICGTEEHTHTDACYEEARTLVCGLEEGSTTAAEAAAMETVTSDSTEGSAGSEAAEAVTAAAEPHVHTDDCYATERVLTCGQEEHTHTEACYEQAGTLTSETADHMTAEVAYDAGEIHQGTYLSASLADDNTKAAALDKIKQATGLDEEKEVVAAFRVYDLKLENSGTEVNPDGNVNVTFTFAGSLAADSDDIDMAGITWKFFALDDNSQAEELTKANTTSIRTNGSNAVEKIGFETEQLQRYAVVGIAEVEEDTDTSGTDNETVTNTSKSTEDVSDETEEIVTETTTVRAKTAKLAATASSENNSITAQSTNDSGVQGGTDYTNYITSVSVQKIIDNRWTNATEFENGDDIRVSMSYTLPAGTLNTNSEASRTIYYQMPEGISISDADSGRVTDSSGSTEIGTYYIGTDGLIRIVFDEAYISNAKGAIDGEIHFEGTASNSSDSDDKVINFGGTSDSITIKKDTSSSEVHDIKTTKTSVLSDDYSKVSYQIETSTTKGTGSKVTITDAFNIYYGNKGYESITYDQESFKVQKRDVNGNLSDVSSDAYNVKFEQDEMERWSFTVTDLPALEAGEAYLTTYTASLVGADDAFQITNDASSNGKTDTNTITVNKIVNKSGYYDQNTGLIAWTITVNPDKLDLSGWVLSDISTYEIVGDVAISSDNTGFSDTILNTSVDNNSITYTFDASKLSDEQKRDSYKIQYHTKAPADSASAENTAKVEKPDGTYQEATGKIDITHRKWGVNKYFREENASATENLITYKWNAIVTLPESSIPTFTYQDTIKNATDKETGSDLGANSHYTTAKSMEEDLNGKLVLLLQDGTKYFYAGSGNSLYKNNDSNNTTSDLNIVVKYYDADGKEVTATDATTKVKSFKVTVNGKDVQEFVGANLTIESYRTYTDTSNLSEKQAINVKNMGSANGIDSEAEHDTNVPEKFIKQVNTIDQYKFESGDISLDYDSINNILTYRLIMFTSETDKNIVVSDLLPEGTTYVDGSLTGGFTKTSLSDFQSTNYSESDFGNSEWFNQHVKVVSEETETGQQSLKINVSDLTYNSTYSVMWLSYQISIENDEVWKSLASAEKNYTNSAKWNGYTASQSTNVKREAKTIDKSGTQLMDENGHPTNTVRYNVIINPAGEDLLEGKDILTLTDKLDLTNISSYNPTLDISSVKLYSIDISKDNNLGKEISSDLYTIVYDPVTAKLTIQLPDETPCILVYDYKVNMTFANDISFSNSVSLSGKWEDSNQIAVKAYSSGASASTRSITVYKVDSANYGVGLSGAKFTLSQWDTDSKMWKDVETNLTTDENGQILFCLSSESSIKENVLYRLSETEAPQGYTKSYDKYYFVYLDENDSEQNAKDSSGAANSDSAIKEIDKSYSWDHVIKFKHLGDNTLYVPNDFTEITVKKVWTDENGVELSDPPGAVKVDLYRQLGEADDYTVTTNVIINGSTVHTYKTQVAKNSSFSITSPEYNGYKEDSLNWLLTYVKVSLDDSELTPAISVGEYNNYHAVYTVDEVTQNITVNVEYLNGSYGDNIWTPYGESSGTITFRDSEKIDTITLDSSCGWTWADSLPATDGNGNKYYYTVVETSEYQGYTTSYTNNGGIQTGKIVINNQKGKNTGFELPHTGGFGTNKIILSGLALMIISLILLLRRKPSGRRSMRK